MLFSLDFQAFLKNSPKIANSCYYANASKHLTSQQSKFLYLPTFFCDFNLIFHSIFYFKVEKLVKMAWCETFQNLILFTNLILTQPVLFWKTRVRLSPHFQRKKMINSENRGTRATSGRRPLMNGELGALVRSGAHCGKMGTFDQNVPKFEKKAI